MGSNRLEEQMVAWVMRLARESDDAGDFRTHLKMDGYSELVSMFQMCWVFCFLANLLVFYCKRGLKWPFYYLTASLDQKLRQVHWVLCCASYKRIVKVSAERTFLTGESALQLILSVGTISSLNVFHVTPCLWASNHIHTHQILLRFPVPLTSLSFRLEKALLFKDSAIAWNLPDTSRLLALLSKWLISNLNYSCKVFLEIPRWDIRGKGHKDWNSADPNDSLCEILNF